MKKIKETIGNTPIVRLNYLSELHGVNLYGKCEFMNPSGSVKDRAAFGMIHDGIDSGQIKNDTHIIEPTSGNTGIALAFICSSLGLKLTLTMPESMSLERRQLLRAYGAQIVLTPAHLGMSGAIEKANELAALGGFIPQQFQNSANPNMHYKNDFIYMVKERHIDLFSLCLNHLKSGFNKLENDELFEIVAEDLKISRGSLDSILGKKSSDDLLGDIFNNFCIGK